MANTQKTEWAIVAKDIEYIKRDMAEIKQSLKDGYVRRDEFEPIKKIVNLITTIVATAVIGALVSLIIKK